MEILDILIGRYILSLIGAVIRYIVHNIFNYKKRKKFNKFWKVKGSDDIVMNNDFANKIVGMAFLFLVIFVIILELGYW